LLELQRKKLGLFESHPGDQDLVDALYNTLADNQVDYTIFFRKLCSFDKHKDHSDLRDLFFNRESFDRWAEKYRHQLIQEQQNNVDRQAAMLKINPKYVFRNYMAEIAIRKAKDEKDYSEIDRMLSLLQSPFDEHLDCEEYAKHPPKWSQKLSVSCSS